MTAIGAEQVRQLLGDRKLFADLPADLHDDTELALDSLGLVWLLHQLEAQYGLVVEPSDADADAFTSIRAITDYLNRAAAPAAGEQR
jgi:acyl carrier protein